MLAAIRPAVAGSPVHAAGAPWRPNHDAVRTPGGCQPAHRQVVGGDDQRDELSRAAALPPLSYAGDEPAAEPADHRSPSQESRQHSRPDIHIDRRDARGPAQRMRERPLSSAESWLYNGRRRSRTERGPASNPALPRAAMKLE